MIKIQTLVIFAIGFAVLVQANPFDLFKERTLLPKTRVATGYRLPGNTRPSMYDVKISTNIHLNNASNPETFKFTGDVAITLTALEDTNNITLHARQLTITGAVLTHSAEGGRQIILKNGGIPEVDEERDFITFRPASDTEILRTGDKFKLEISFNGVLRTDNQGFYRSFYIDEEGNPRWLATTQFESTDSRHGFPCYDEPSIRAEFKITINHDSSYRAISNMPIDKIENDILVQGRVNSIFKVTVKTHPSILAYAISDFKYVGKEVENETPQRVYARKEAIDSGIGDFGLDAGVAILRQLENYLDTPYTLDKLDQISIPDFSAGAMENWGLVTYREELFLYDPKKSALSLKEKVATIVAHEYAHMYFGNLVSIKWWNVAWLKEGFATYFEYVATAAVYPEFRDDDYFVIKAQHNAFVTDALETSRPMTFYVEDPVGISAVFDFVIYSKAGSVIRMWQHALTEPVFRHGLQIYLKNMSLQAADSDNLAEALQQAVNNVNGGIRVKELIDSWSTKAGYPVVTVSRGSDNKLTFKQEKFSYTKSASTELFMVPISFTTAKQADFHDTAPKVWLNGATIEVSTALPWTESDWIIANIQESGYYRVNYDSQLWELIRRELWSDSFDKIHHLNRAQLVDDVLNLARAGYIDYATAFPLLQYLAKETDFAPWTAASKGFDYLNRLLIDSKAYDLFKRYINELVTPLYQSLTLNDGGASETLDIKDSRNIAIRWACLSGDKGCIEQTAAKVIEVIEKPETDIEANTRQTIYCNGLREANVTIFDSVVDRLQKTVDLAARTILIGAIGCTQNPELQKKYLESSITETGNNYRAQERNRILDAVYLNGGKSGLEASIDFLNEKWSDVEEFYSPSNPVKKAVNRMAELITSSELNEKFLTLLNTLQTGGIVDAQERTALLATVKSNLDWVEANDKDIEDFFKKLYSGAPSVSLVSTLMMSLVTSVLILFR